MEVTRAVEVLILALIAAQAPTSEFEVVRYDNHTLPQRFQHSIAGRHWWPLNVHFGAEEPVGFGRRSNPNWVDPWRPFPQGCEGVQGLGLNRSLAIPKGKKIQTWVERHQPPNMLNVFTVRRWRFPIGTTVTEDLFVDGKPWVTRSRTKRGPRAQDWEPDEVHHSDAPPGYQVTTRTCHSCHKDAGSHASQMPGNEKFNKPGGHAWYGYCRGNDSCFSWRPTDDRGRVLPQYRHIVEEVRR